MGLRNTSWKVANKQGSSVCTRFAFNTCSIPPRLPPLPPPPPPRHDFHRATDVHVSRHVNRTRGTWYTRYRTILQIFLCVSSTRASFVPRNVTYTTVLSSFLFFFFFLFYQFDGNIRILLFRLFTLCLRFISRSRREATLIQGDVVRSFKL